MKTATICLLILTLSLTSCGPRSSSSRSGASRLTVFAAASLTDAFTELGHAFEAVNPGKTVTFSFAGSQTLRTQIEAGAPADVFASANTAEMDALVKEGLVAADAPKVFLTNQLAVIMPAANPSRVSRLQDLANPGLKLVLAAEDVPAGKYARIALDLMDASFGRGFKDKVLAEVVSNEEDVRHVLTKVQLGEADAGIVYTSDAVSAPALKTIAIPADMNVIARYPIAPLLHSANADLAARFAAYVLSEAGQTVLRKWGFGPAN